MRALLTLAMVLGLAGMPVGAEITVSVLAAPADLAPGIAAFPRLTGNTLAAARINADLEQREQAFLADTAECRDEPGSDWNRFVEVAYAGPQFLSLHGTDEDYCAGAAHPNTGDFALTYDLGSGTEVSWPEILGRALLPLAPAQGDVPGSDFASRALTQLYLARYSADNPQDCTDAVRSEDLRFIFWLDGRKGALAMQPDNLAHVVQACADPVWLSAADLRDVGASAALIQALTAH
jgi:hypothetical protein